MTNPYIKDNLKNIVGVTINGRTIIDLPNKYKQYGASRYPYVRFRCERCGNEYEVIYMQLMHAYKKGTTYCGNCIKEQHKSKEPDIIDKQFGPLVVLGHDGKWLGKTKTLWICKCTLCGKIQTRLTKYLTDKTTCGCMQERTVLAPNRNIMHEKYMQEGTSLIEISPNRAKNQNSTTGVNGVSQLRSGKYRAYLMLKRHQIHLGTYDTLEEAAKARKKGEEDYFKPVLEKYEKENNEIDKK